jgi:amino acid transporter
VLWAAAKPNDMPKVFAKQNQNKVPAAAPWLTNVVVQLFVISTCWPQDAFSLMLKMTSAMSLIPYFLVAAYAFEIANRRETYQTRPQERRRDTVIAGLAALYSAFMIYAGGMKYLRRWHEVRVAVGCPLRARNSPLLLGSARRGQEGLHTHRVNHLSRGHWRLHRGHPRGRDG